MPQRRWPRGRPRWLQRRQKKWTGGKKEYKVRREPAHRDPARRHRPLEPIRLSERAACTGGSAAGGEQARSIGQCTRCTWTRAHTAACARHEGWPCKSCTRFGSPHHHHPRLFPQPSHRRTRTMVWQPSARPAHCRARCCCCCRRRGCQWRARPRRPPAHPLETTAAESPRAAVRGAVFAEPRSTRQTLWANRWRRYPPAVGEEAGGERRLRPRPRPRRRGRRAP